MVFLEGTAVNSMYAVEIQHEGDGCVCACTSVYVHRGVPRDLLCAFSVVCF